MVSLKDFETLNQKAPKRSRGFSGVESPVGSHKALEGLARTTSTPLRTLGARYINLKLYEASKALKTLRS